MGRVDVLVTTPDGTSAANTKDRFAFTPLITGLEPSAGPAGGGTTVTLTGFGFAPGTTGTVVRFGAARSQSVNCVSASLCTALAPAHAAGTLEVQALVGGTISVKSAGAKYTYE